MAYLAVKKVKRFRYFYIVESVRRGDKVGKKILEYLGRDPDKKRLSAALRYWKVKAKRAKGRRRKT